MNSSITGTTIFQSKVTAIGELGFWVLVDNGLDFKEYFIPFDDYPGFRNATVAQIFTLEQSGPGQLHWPELDEDIEINALERPDLYPLRAKRK